MEALSEKYGWLPSQIRNEKLNDIQAYVKIIEVKNRLAKAEYKKLNAK